MFVNLTPHAITLVMPDGDRTIPPSGTVARVAMQSAQTGEILGIPVYVTSPGLVTIGADDDGSPLPMPEPASGHVYIVSGMVLDHPELAGRTDCVAPFRERRDEQGRITGCLALRRRGGAQ